MMLGHERLLLENKAWATEKVQDDPQFFERLADVQTPEYLWIGCSDSRVPANEITGTNPGEIFVHRNIANMVVHTDLNMLSVLQYAVQVLKVKHVIVCGHYGCGGVKAAMTQHSFGMINKWLRNIKDVYRFHESEIEALATDDKKVNRLIELNVKEQVMNLAKTSIVQKAWKENQFPHLHGWVYGLDNGILHPIFEMQAGSKLEKIYTFDNL
ncbi:carbonate dehydratase [Pollutibacter soli]|uniref:carbonate dehydratase n=1 Tax=Pollutibacter soli TaxID=3034157 RepID=UPI003AF6EBC5